MRALVTGATGFLGSRVAAQLVANGDDVRVLVRTSSDRSRLDGLPIEIAVGDVTDAASVEAALTDVDTVFHVAAYVELGATDPTMLEAVNVGGARNVLGAAAERELRCVHVSSVSALGPTGPDLVDESWWNPAPPTVDYERTKRAAHEYARELVAKGAKLRIGSPGGIYGFGDESSMAQLIHTFVSYPTPLGYMPELVQSLVNVDDCAAALIAMADQADDGEEFILCADAVPFRRWFELIAAGAGRRPPMAYLPTSAVQWSARPAAAITRLLGGNPSSITDTVDMATRNQAYSGDKARRELGWTPRSLRQGMAEMAVAIMADNERRRAERRAAREAARR